MKYDPSLTLRRIMKRFKMLLFTKSVSIKLEEKPLEPERVVLKQREEMQEKKTEYIFHES